ncbi:MAG TPA: VOC family protein [Casimicrobiaceae bacterium]|nr:VOC family protein [Casimicrobiaceae bacterium]
MTDAALAQIDHLIFGASTLAQGIEYFAELTGVAPQPGGKHAGMATHNALVKLGERVYLEIIAIDPQGEKPLRKRWFDLDDGNLMADLVERPQLIHWVARTRDVEFASSRAGYETGPVLPFSRGPYRWRITVPDDGRRPGRGVLPTLMQWDVPQHPADALPSSGVSIAQFAASHPEPAIVRRSLQHLGVADEIHVTFDRNARLAAMLRTPRGLVAI